MSEVSDRLASQERTQHGYDDGFAGRASTANDDAYLEGYERGRGDLGTALCPVCDHPFHAHKQSGCVATVIGAKASWPCPCQQKWSELVKGERQ